MSHTPEKNVGLLVFSRKRPGFDQEWSKVVRERAIAGVAALGLHAVGADEPVFDDATISTALAAIRSAGCDALVVVQPSIADGQFAFSVMQQWAGPVVLWATPEKPGDGKVSSCSLVGTHLWASIFRQARYPFELVYGDGLDVTVQAELSQAIAIAATVMRLSRAKVGVVGTHVPGFVDLAADAFLVKKALGIQMHSLSLPQYIDRVKAVPEERVQADMEKVRALRLPTTTGAEHTVSDETLAISSRFYLSMLDLMEESRLDALALQCWPELPNLFQHWPYLAVSRLTSENKCVSIEGDVDGAIQSLMGHLLAVGSGFLTDWLEHDDSTIFFWHPGMASLDMCHAVGSEQGPSIGAHFNGGQAAVIDGPLSPGEAVTVARLWRCDDQYHMAAFAGQSIAPRRRVTGNSLLVEAGEGVHKRFDELVHAGLPHHLSLYRGDVAETFRRLARNLGVVFH